MKATLLPNGSLHLESLAETRIVRPLHPSYDALAALYHQHGGVALSNASDDESVFPEGYGGYPWRGGTPVYGQTYDIPLEDIYVDPHRFQFKKKADTETGVTTELDRDAFDPDQCEDLGVWKDPANGRTYIVDGHHRRELGERAGIHSMYCKYIKAGSAEEARRIGAAMNGVQLSQAQPNDDADDPGHDLMADILYGMYGDSALARVIADNWNKQGITPDTLTEDEVENIKNALHGTNHHIAWSGGKWSMAKSDDDAVSLSSSNWTAHQGKRGGRGWKNTATGEIRYQANAPKERARKDVGTPAPRAKKQAEAKADKPAQAAKPTTESPAQPAPKQPAQPAPQPAAPKPASKPAASRSKKGSPEAVATAQKAVSAVLSGQGGVSSDDLVGHLANLTVAQLQALHKHHGVRAPGRLRANLIESVKARNAGIDGRNPAPAETAKSQLPGGKADSKPAQPVEPRRALPNPIKQVEKRPYRFAGNNVREMARYDKSLPTQMLDPSDLVSPQKVIASDVLARIQGDIREPILVVKHGGKLYLEEGNHRAASAMKQGKKVPARVIELTDDGESYRAAKGESQTHPAQAVLHSIKTSQGLSDEQRKSYSEAAQSVLARMPSGAVAQLQKHLKSSAFYADTSKVGEGYLQSVLQSPAVDENIKASAKERLEQIKDGSFRVSGAYMPLDKSLHMNGDSELSSGGNYGTQMIKNHLYSHELSHVIDGISSSEDGSTLSAGHSQSPEWADVAESEINQTVNGKAALTDYAQENAQEGFAEFGRLLYSGEYNLEDVAKNFPKASAYFKKNQLWPEQGGDKPASAFADVFDGDKRQDFGDGGHTDTLIAQGKTQLSSAISPEVQAEALRNLRAMFPIRLNDGE